MKGKKGVYKGVASVFATLFVVSSFGSSVANQYAGRINTVLGIQTSKIVDNGSGGEDTVYYKSDYGSDRNDTDQLAALEADAAMEEIEEVQEGAVLLKNDNNALPLAKGSSITLFGNNSINPFYSYHSTGNSMQTLFTYVDAMKEVYDVNEATLTAYENSGVTRVKNADNPVIGEAPVSVYTDDVRNSWQSSYNDAAVVMLTREAGEDCDFQMTDPEGISALALHQDEKDMLQMLKEEKEAGVFGKIIVLVNANSAMELGWLDDYDVDACVWVGTPGIVGFGGIVNVLDGDATPSGHLVDTYATDSLAAPAYVNAGENVSTWENLADVVAYCSDQAKYVAYYLNYAEDIYVGYKYFETRYEDSVLGQGNAEGSAGASQGSTWNYADEVVYPFGYGLSYTTFDQTLDNVSYDESTDTYTVDVTVTNTGDVAGKSVVEVYAQTPYGDYEKENGVEKSAVQLVGFAKTDALEPGTSQKVSVSVDRYLLASYDTNGAQGYILSSGDYYLAIGDDAHDALNNILAAKNADGLTDSFGNDVSGDADKAYTWNQAALDTDTYRNSSATGTEVTNKLQKADLNNWIPDSITYLSRSDWEGTWPTKISVTATQDMMAELDDQSYSKPADASSVSDYTQGENAGITWIQMKDVDYDDEKWDTFLNQLTIEEMASILTDQNGSAELSTIGLPASYRGDDMDCLEQVTFKANGKSGIVWQSAVMLAATWNTECVAKRAAFTGNEAFFMGCTEIWSGGPNFHRTQFCGRNNAYYSEDANLDYLIGEVMCESVQKYGVILGYKHVVLNEQEYHRESVATFANEQTIREIYLRAFEGAYKNSGCLGCMTAFNRVGLTYAGSCAATMTDIMRGEWGFEGVICSDAAVGTDYKTHYAENITAGLDYWCWDMAGFGGPPAGGAPDGAPAGAPAGDAGAADAGSNTDAAAADGADAAGTGETAVGDASAAGDAAADASGDAQAADADRNDSAPAAAVTQEELPSGGNSGTYSAGGVSSAVIPTLIEENDDGYLLGALRRAVKDQLYAELKTNLTNGLSESSTIEIITPWWQSLILALRIVTGLGCAAFVVLYLLKLREDDAAVSVAADKK